VGVRRCRARDFFLLDELAVVAQRNVFANGEIPQVAWRGGSDVVIVVDDALAIRSLVIVRAATVRVVRWRCLLDVVRRIRGVDQLCPSALTSELVKNRSKRPNLSASA